MRMTKLHLLAGLLLASISQVGLAGLADGGASALPMFDLNGDDYSDVVIVTNDGTSSSQQLLLGQSGGIFCPVSEANDCEIHYGIDYGIDSENYMRNPATRLIPGDFDGDPDGAGPAKAKSDLLVVSGDPSVPRRMLLISTGSTFAAACVGEQDGACGFDTEPYMFHPLTKLIPGDFNGDGKTDVLVVSGDPAFPRRALLLSTGTGFSESCIGQVDGACGFDTEPYMFNPLTKLIPGDFNGDGKTDILVISGDPTFSRRALMLSNGSTFSESCIGQQDGACGFDTEPYMFSLDTRLVAGDFNGDGKTDVMVVSGDTAFPRRMLLRSTGSTFVDSCVGNQNGACGLDTDPYMFNPHTRVIGADFNGDGKTDLMVISGDRNDPRRRLLVSTGTSFATACTGQQDGACGLDNQPYMFNHMTRIDVGDYDSDGRQDLLVLSADAAFPRRTVLHSNGTAFVSSCVDAACHIDDSVAQHPFDAIEVPSFAYNHPAHQLASTFIAEPDITRSLKWATENQTSLIELDGSGGTPKVYESGRIWLRSNQTLAWSPDVTLLATSSGFADVEDAFINILDATHVSLRGASGAELKMRKADYTSSDPPPIHNEWRHAVKITSSDGIWIQDLAIRDSGGDGIYLGETRDINKPNRDVHISNILSDNNARNGLSVISVNGLEVLNSTFSNSTPLTGLAPNGPWAGIDFEPNFRHQQLQNILVRNCIVRDNQKWGVLFAFGEAQDGDLSAYPFPFTIQIEQTAFTGAAPTVAAIGFNREALSMLSSPSVVGLSNISINLVDSYTGWMLNRLVSGNDRGVSQPNANYCGFGVNRSPALSISLCKINASGDFIVPSLTPVEPWHSPPPN
jgi:hypothetical protein